MLFLEPKRTYWRKMEEVLLALWLEYRLEKRQILELYLNRIYFGAGNYGVEAAAQHYFGKSVGELGLYESALFAGLIRAPSYFAPTRNLRRAQQRGKTVLGLMLETEAITREQYDAALRDPPKLRAFLPSESFGYVIDWVVKQVADFRQHAAIRSRGADHHRLPPAGRGATDRRRSHGRARPTNTTPGRRRR